MKKLNLPVFTVPMSEPDPLSMDDYYRFVLFSLTLTPEKQTLPGQEEDQPAAVPFVLKD